MTMRWHDETTSDLPRLLLVGDSIVNGHASLLNQKLKEKYSVDAFTSSKIVSDHEFMSDLKQMLSKHKYEIIIFNNGLHGSEVDDVDYASELFNVLSELKNDTTRLFWRNSTPCYTCSGDSENLWTERVKKRNDLARIEVEKLNIPIIDCYTLLENRPELVVDGVHFHTEGYQIIVDVIAEFLAKENLL